MTKRAGILVSAALAVASFLMTASFCYAQGPGMASMAPHQFDGDRDGRHDGGIGGRLPHGTWWRNPATVTAIGLSSDQQKKIDDIFMNARVQLIHMHASLEENQLRLDDALNAPQFDAARAQKYIDEGADLRASLEKADAHMLLSIRGVLTADQWTRLQNARRMKPEFDRDLRRGDRNGPHPRGFDRRNAPPSAPPPAGAPAAPPTQE